LSQQRKAFGENFSSVFSFRELGCIILLAGHAGKAWSDLVSKKRHNNSSRSRIS